jgi:hypothetical protein
MKTSKKTTKRVTKKKPQPTKRSELRSGFEFKVLQSLKSQGVPFEYETEKLEYIVPEHVKRYIPDFIITTTKGRTIYCEAKGRWLAADRKKHLMVKEQHPDKDIRILFMKDLPIRKGSSTLYSTFCKKHGITFAVSPSGTIPERWICE